MFRRGLGRSAAALVAAIVLVAPAAAEAKNLREEVFDHYVQGLGRNPDPTGFLHFTRNAAGRCAAGLAESGRSLLLSGEYAGRNRSNHQRVYDVYRTILQREPDSGGYSHYRSRLDSGWSWTWVVDTINGSAEAQNRRTSICNVTDLPVRWVHMGDSFSSGTGTRSYYDASCERSWAAYPYLTSIPQGGWTSLRFVACGGAKTGLQGSPNALKDLWQMQLPHLDRATGIVTFSIGGNDANFSAIALQCAKPWPTTCWGDLDKAEAIIRHDLPGRYDRIIAEVKRRSPAARIVLVGYPRLFGPQECNGVGFTSIGEQERMIELINLLASVTSAAASRGGVRYADVRSKFTGHHICTGSNEWINGASSPTSESYHPNSNGHRLGYAPVVGPKIG